MSNPKNGDVIVDECVFCDMAFDEPQKLGSRIVCEPDEGGCGLAYKIAILPPKKAQGDSE